MSKKAVKAGSRTIGYISSPTNVALPFYGVDWLRPDGQTERVGGASSYGRAAAMLREHDARRTGTPRLWKVKLANGSTAFIDAVTEAQACERAHAYLRRWAANQLAAVSARVAEAEEMEEPGFYIDLQAPITFSQLVSPSSTRDKK